MHKPKIHIAVTGTKGKSTTLRSIQHGFMLNETSVWGTFGLDGRYYNSIPYRKVETIDNYLLVEEEAEVHLSEATSFVLKTEGIYQKNSLDVAVFTSFDKTEHMEIHYTGESYLSDKLKIFNLLKKEGISIINRDIEEFEKIYNSVPGEVITYGFSSDSDCVVKEIKQSLFGSAFELTYEGNKHVVVTKLLGRTSMLNTCAAILTLLKTTDLPIEKIVQDMSSFPGLKGRYNLFKIPDTNTEIIIDYAHTADSLESLLKTVREVFDKKIICIFGCGGNKSVDKRPQMGSVADQNSDQVIITNDNPRQESPHKIVNDIMKGVNNTEKFTTILDRSLAIRSTLDKNHNCVIVIAGKGAEDSIKFADFEYNYSDHNTVLTYAVSNQYTMMKANPYVD